MPLLEPYVDVGTVVISVRRQAGLLKIALCPK